MNTQEQIAEEYHRQITEWVKDNFGGSEAEDPSWNIEALAKELADHAYTIHGIVERAYVKEDFETYAKDMKLDATDQQLDQAVDNYMNSDAYVAIDLDVIDYFIMEEMVGGENV